MILHVRFFLLFTQQLFPPCPFLHLFSEKQRKTSFAKVFVQNSEVKMRIPSDLAIHNHFHHVIVLIFIFSISLSSSMRLVHKDKQMFKWGRTSQQPQPDMAHCRLKKNVFIVSRSINLNRLNSTLQETQKGSKHCKQEFKILIRRREIEYLLLSCSKDLIALSNSSSKTFQ